MRFVSKIILVYFAFWLNFSAFTQGKQDPPKLVVGIVVDQMCYDYLYRFYPNFSNGGFKRMMTKGSNIRNVTYNYVPTFTGPGHASIYTGTTPSNHGIVGNDWYIREKNQEVNCVADSTVLSVGTSSSDGLASPHFLKANTITDQLKLTYPTAKVIGCSIKDRGAILPAGHIANGAYWYDYETGNFVSSSHYMNQLPSWVVDFRLNNPLSNYLSKSWNLSFPEMKYQHADNQIYEQSIFGKTIPTFPYDLTKFSASEQINYFTIMPAANTYLTDFAISSIKGEDLGTDETTDILTISFSTPDICGHSFGPYSIEIEDMYYKLDKEIQRLFLALDSEIGKNEYVVFLTADHAVVPVPQMLNDLKLPGGYLFTNEKYASLKEKGRNKFGFETIAQINDNNVYLTNECRENPLFGEVVAFIQKEIMSWDEVKAVYTAKELLSSQSDALAQMVANGFDFKRSGDLIFTMNPGYLTKSSELSEKKGTSHGSAYNYDTHVPVLFYGKNIGRQDVFTPYQITDISATLVHILNLQRPNAMTGKPILELLPKK
jgi:predicted AlkP superfamily pyrophosphatase or phosphodiesterase